MPEEDTGCLPEARRVVMKGRLPRRGFSLQAIVGALFMVKLHESIDAGIKGDKSDAAFTYGP
jgi:hypothetical protein